MTTTLNASTAGAGGFIATSDNSGSLALQTAGTTAIYVDTSQNVGIGTTSPSGRLHVSAPASTQYGTFDAVTATSAFTNYKVGGTVYGYLGDASGLVTGGTAGDLAVRFSGAMVFSGGANERMRIDSSGNLLVGKTASGSATAGVQIEPAGAVGATRSGDIAYFANRLTSDGSIFSFRRNSSEVGSISVTASATAYNTSSDYRLKENIAPMTGALAKVAQLKPVIYKWKVDGSDGEGFIAHELAEVCPQAVHGTKDEVDADGNPVYQGIDTSFLVATLTAAIQELKAINDTQAETLTQQTEAINALTARIVAIESKA